MTQWAITNMLDTNEKRKAKQEIETLSRETEDIKKEPNGNFKLKNNWSKKFSGWAQKSSVKRQTLAEYIKNTWSNYMLSIRNWLQI